MRLRAERAANEPCVGQLDALVSLHRAPIEIGRDVELAALFQLLTETFGAVEELRRPLVARPAHEEVLTRDIGEERTAIEVEELACERDQPRSRCFPSDRLFDFGKGLFEGPEVDPAEALVDVETAIDQAKDGVVAELAPQAM